MTLPQLEFPAGQSSVTVDFDFRESYISFPVSINGMPAEEFGFDTGSTNTIATNWARAKGLKFDAAGVSMGGGAGEAAAGMAAVNRIEIGGLRLTNQDVSVTDLPGDSWRGVLGYELARSTAVQIDYASRRITFRKPVNAVAIPIRFAANSEPLVEASIDGKRGEFELDTGQDIALSVNRPFAERNGLMRKYGAGVKGAVEGIGGQSETIESGDVYSRQFQARNRRGGYPALRHRSSRGGARCRLDRQRNSETIHGHARLRASHGLFREECRLWPTRCANQSAPIESLTRPAGNSKDGWVGIAKLRLPGKTVEILELDPEGAAARGGIAVGDQIAGINGRRTEDLLKPVKLGSAKVIVHYLDNKYLLAAPGTEITLTIKPGDRVWNVKLVTLR